MLKSVESSKPDSEWKPASHYDIYGYSYILIMLESTKLVPKAIDLPSIIIFKQTRTKTFTVNKK